MAGKRKVVEVMKRAKETRIKLQSLLLFAIIYKIQDLVVIATEIRNTNL